MNLMVVDLGVLAELSIESVHLVCWSGVWSAPDVENSSNDFLAFGLATVVATVDLRQ